MSIFTQAGGDISALGTRLGEFKKEMKRLGAEQDRLFDKLQDTLQVRRGNAPADRTPMRVPGPFGDLPWTLGNSGYTPKTLAQVLLRHLPVGRATEFLHELLPTLPDSGSSVEDAPWAPKLITCVVQRYSAFIPEATLRTHVTQWIATGTRDSSVENVFLCWWNSELFGKITDDKEMDELLTNSSARIGLGKALML